MSSIYVKWIEPSWIFPDGGQSISLALANLRANLGNELSASKFYVSLSGLNCVCTSLSSKDTVDLLNCVTPALPYGTGSTTLEVKFSGQDLCNRAVLVDGGTSSPMMQFLTPMSETPTATLKFSTGIVEFKNINQLDFQIIGTQMISRELGSMEIQIKPSRSTSCSIGAQSDCLRFKNSVYNLLNMTVWATGQRSLQGSGILNLSSCPSIFCGLGGWGVDFDMTLVISGRESIQKQMALRMVPKGTFSVVNLHPSSVPSKRSFTVDAITDIFRNHSIISEIKVEFRDVNGSVRSGTIQKISAVPGSNRYKITLVVPAVSSGQIAGRFYSGGDIIQRSTTISTFSFFCNDDPLASASAPWASTTRGAASGGTTVMLLLSSFPMIDASSQVMKRNDVTFLHCPIRFLMTSSLCADIYF